MVELTDEQALSLAAQGDPEAFSALYERYVTRIYNYIFYRTGNPNDAEDLTARVFQRALGHITTYRDMGVPFAAWLYRIAHNLVANWHRDNSRKQEVPLEDHENRPFHQEHPEATVMAGEETAMLLKAIHRLSPERQQLLILKFVDRLSNAEVAVVMGKTEGAIKSLYHRTLLVLRDHIGKTGDDTTDDPKVD